MLSNQRICLYLLDWRGDSAPRPQSSIKWCGYSAPSRFKSSRIQWARPHHQRTRPSASQRPRSTSLNTKSEFHNRPRQTVNSKNANKAQPNPKSQIDHEIDETSFQKLKLINNHE